MLGSTRITSNSDFETYLLTGSRWDTCGVASCVARLGDERRSEAEPRGGHITFVRMRAAARLPAGRHAFDVVDIGRVPAEAGYGRKANSRSVHALCNKL